MADRVAPRICRFRMPTGFTLGLGGVLFLLVVWQLVGQLSPLLMSSPVAVIKALTNGDFLHDLLPALGSTLGGFATGFGIGAVIGVALGYFIAASRWAELILEPYVNALYSVPRIALIPLLILWTGIGFELRVVVVVLSCMFPIIVNTHQGARDVPAAYRDVARSARASSWQFWRTVTVPASMPFTVAGLRIGIMRALTAMIVAELVAAISGTGQLLRTSAQFLETDRLLATLIVLGCIGMVLSWAVDWMGRQYLGRRGRDSGARPARRRERAA